MIIIGVGVSPDTLTKEAIEAIENASIIYGSKRAIEIASRYIKSNSNEITDYKSLHLLPSNAIILSTGDPMLSGLGKYASKKDTVIAGISSLQIVCARLKINLTNLAIITAHGRETDIAKKEFIIELKLGKNIFLLPDKLFGVKEIIKIIKNNSNNLYDIFICENLGMDSERIVYGTIDNPPSNNSDLFCIMVVKI